MMEVIQFQTENNYFDLNPCGENSYYDSENGYDIFDPDADVKMIVETYQKTKQKIFTGLHLYYDDPKTGRVLITDVEYIPYFRNLEAEKMFNELLEKFKDVF